jgi:hypothetical protein
MPAIGFTMNPTVLGGIVFGVEVKDVTVDYYVQGL